MQMRSRKEIKLDILKCEENIATLNANSAVVKIMTNGTFGKLNSVYSILYAPHLMLDTTITGQLSLLMLIESLSLSGFDILSANTDGFNVKYTKPDKINKIVGMWEKQTGLSMEFSPHKALYSRDVNSYVAVYSDHVKSKGFYGEPSLSKNPEYPIVTEAIREFLLSGKSMKKTIKRCKDPVKFCVSRAVTGGALWSDEEYPDTEEYTYYLANRKKQNKALEKRNDDFKKQFILAEADKWYIGKTVRYYYAIDGKPMFYKKSGNKAPKSEGCKPMMDLSSSVPKDLDYDKYLELAKTHLKELGYEK
jgi:hypothetical protein